VEYGWSYGRHQRTEDASGAGGDTMKVHQLKTWPEYFKALKDGTKNFELRKNDRDFRVGDILYLKEYNPETEAYTSRSLEFYVTYIIDGEWGLKEGYCAMALMPYDDILRKLLVVANHKHEEQSND
jgi:hypothetical protein